MSLMFQNIGKEVPEGTVLKLGPGFNMVKVTNIYYMFNGAKIKEIYCNEAQKAQLVAAGANPTTWNVKEYTTE